MLSFHTPEWAKIHEDYRQIIKASYDAEEFAQVVQASRRTRGMQVLIAARDTGDKAVLADAVEFLNLWFGFMNRIDIEFELTYFATAVWSWQERR